MALTLERNSELDAELERMWARLVEIAVEVQQAAVPTDKHGFTHQSACRAGDAIQFFRHMLE